MRNIIILSIIIFFLTGCKTTGYDVKLSTILPVTYNEYLSIESIFTERGFAIIDKERVRYGANSQIDVYTLLKKDITNNQHEDILVMISFVKDKYTNNANNFKVAIYNHFVGSILTGIKNEIDALGDLAFKHLSGTIGANNVSISRKEWGPPKY